MANNYLEKAKSLNEASDSALKRLQERLDAAKDLLSQAEALKQEAEGKLVEANLFRGRIFIENFDEVLIPIIMYFLTRNVARKGLFLVLLVFISVFSLLESLVPYSEKNLLDVFA